MNPSCTFLQVKFLFFAVFYMLVSSCSKNPLGEDLALPILNLGFRISGTCPTVLTQDETYQCSSLSVGEDISSPQWSLEPSGTCGSWLTINSNTGVISGVANDDQVGTCTADVRARSGQRISQVLPVTITTSNLAPTLSLTNATAISEDAPLTLIKANADVQASEEGFGIYSLDNATVAAPACANNSLVLSIDAATGAINFQPAQDYAGTCYIRVVFDDQNNAANSTVAAEFSITVNPVNDSPVIAPIADIIMQEGVAYDLNFNISDVDSTLACSALYVSVSSTNAALINPTAIVLSGTAPNCTAQLNPTVGQMGTADLTFIVSDGALSAAQTFRATVTFANDPPVISSIADVTINEDGSTVINFTITDVDNVLTCSALNLAATSSNVSLLPTSQIVFAGTVPNCTATLTPLAQQSGVSNVTFTVSDNGLPSLQASESFSLTVSAVNDAPTISAVSNQTIAEDTSTAALAFTIDDLETAASLTCAGSVMVDSSNTGLLPASQIVVSGTAPNCQVVATPNADQFGSAVVTLTLTDAGLPLPAATAQRSFTLTVNSVNDLPQVSVIASTDLKTDSSVVLPFTITDVDHTLNCTSSVSVSSSNLTALPVGNIVRGGTAPNCTLTITPTANTAANVTVTYAVSDGVGSVSPTFQLNLINVTALAHNFSTLNMGTGGTQQLISTATYSDASTAVVTTQTGSSWASSNAAAATVNNAVSKGLVTSVAGGTANITSTYKGLTATTAVTVISINSVTVSNSNITGGMGSVMQITATAQSNVSTFDITNTGVWTTSDAGVATVSNGQIQFLSTGTATVTVTYAGLSANVLVTVEPKSLISIVVTGTGGETLQAPGTKNFIATAHYSDASTQVVTNSATWSSSNTAVATVSNTLPTIGRVTGVAMGTSVITATVGSVSGNVLATIDAPTLTSIAITPYDALVTSNGSYNLRAIGTYSDATTSDITELVTWSSSNTLAATVSNAAGSKGVATTPSFTGYRTTNITASLGAVSGVSPFGVNGATVSSVLVTPTVTITVGQTYQLTVYANLSDGGVIDVTSFSIFSSATVSAVTVSNSVGSKGLVTGVATGSSVITAYYGGVAGTRTVSVGASSVVTPVGTGLTGNYFNFTGGSPPASPFVPANRRGTRIDSRVAFSWGSGAAPMGVSDYFAVRWTGFYQATGTTTYLCTRSDDGVRVWFNGVQIINNWTNHSPTWNCSGALAVTAGTQYSVVIEYYENGGGSEIQFTQSAVSAADAQNQTTRLVPQAQLFPQ